MEIPEIAVPAHAGHVVDAESVDGGVVVAVARAVVPALKGIGAELDHSEGEDGTGVGLAAAVDAGGGHVADGTDFCADVFAVLHRVSPLARSDCRGS